MRTMTHCVEHHPLPTFLKLTTTSHDSRQPAHRQGPSSLAWPELSDVDQTERRRDWSCAYT